MELDFNLKPLNIILGFNITDEIKSNFWRVFCVYLLVFTALVQDALCIANRVMEPYSVISRLWLAFHVLGSLQIPFRHLYFKIQQKKIAALIKQISAPLESESEEFNQLETNMKVQSMNKIERFCKIYFIYQLFSLFVVVLGGVVSIIVTVAASFGEETGASPAALFSPMYWPTNPLETPTYYFLMLFQSSCIIFNVATSFTADSLACSLMLAASERAAFLARTAPQALLPGPDNTITPQFRAWVQYHQHYLSIIDNINNAMSPLLLYIHSMMYMFIILYCYALLKFDDAATYAVAIFFMMGTIISLLVYSSAGQKVLNKSVELRNSVVGVAQVSAGGLGVGPARNALQVLVTRLSGGAGPEKITGLGYFTISMEFFNTVLSSAFSYLMILLSFK